MRNSAVQNAINEMTKARHGGDYAAIFQGKSLSFKFSKIRDDASELNETSLEVAEAMTPVVEAVADSPIVSSILEIGALIKAGGRLLLEGLRVAFKRLIEIFDSLRQALEAAFAPLCATFDLVLDTAINFLIDMLPNAFVEFVQGIIAAVLPFIGQIKACGTMLVSVGNFVAQAIKHHGLERAAVAIDATNRFSTAARDAIMRILDAELRRTGATAIMDTANAGVSVAGLVWTGNVAGTVVGIATSLAKLCIKLADILADLRVMRAGNALLALMKQDPRRDVNPAELFSAAPILGCTYLAVATQSSLIANTGFLDSWKAKTTITDAGWMSEYEAKARQLSPLRLTAMKMCAVSRLELTTNSQMGVLFDFDLKDEVRSKISDAVSGRSAEVLGSAASARFMPA
ncbi:hypothetical protein [Limnohabitans sp. Rim8]|jgi:hypothetical protein|uniref:hypothetical protein n=1 Tax=Limnohabitans sp. Rim8 TaxID=1100718 RepID=UPI0025D68CD3|nr:hypothetical protein [Limnohabitans sp. Rim8]